MGVWDALGQGIQSGVQNWLERKRLAEEQAARLASQNLQTQQLGVQREQAGLARQTYEEGAAHLQATEQEAKNRRLSDYSDPAKGIFVYDYDELSPGVFVPVPRDEQFKRYQVQYARWQQEQEAQAEKDYQRELGLAEKQAQFNFKYSKAGQEGTAPKFNLLTPDGRIDPYNAETVLRQVLADMGVNYTAKNLPLIRPEILELVQRDYGLAGRIAFEAWLDLKHPMQVAVESFPQSRPASVLENRRLPIEQAGAQREAQQQAAATEQFYQGAPGAMKAPTAAPGMSFEEFLAEFKRNNPLLPPQAMLGAAKLAYNKQMIGP